MSLMPAGTQLKREPNAATNGVSLARVNSSSTSHHFSEAAPALPRVFPACWGILAAPVERDRDGTSHQERARR